jgi:phenylpropionate dioxygenase-like ring-hydroxylating dioxygenase large terminal subunit
LTALPDDWAKTLSEPAEFCREQADLATVWTFLGLASDIPRDGDWFRATLATRSVFVQRFGSELRCFENICQHRYYPLRTSARGNGRIVCGFHHWHYDKEGRLVGAPMSKEVFGKLPREMDVCLNRLELATCGDLVFGRFAGGTGTLDDSLGELAPVLEAMTAAAGKRVFAEMPIAANWKLYFHATLDDYHVAAVHPNTLGKAGPVLPRHVCYTRLGFHSAYIYSDDPAEFDRVIAECRDGTYRSGSYFIIQVLPNLAVFHAGGFADFWHCGILNAVPEAHDRSSCRTWMWVSPFPTATPWRSGKTRALAQRLVLRFAAAYSKRVHREDHRVCEEMQKVADQLGKGPIIGRLEERIGWFENALRSVRGLP